MRTLSNTNFFYDKMRSYEIYTRLVVNVLTVAVAIGIQVNKFWLFLSFISAVLSIFGYLYFIINPLVPTHVQQLPTISNFFS